MNFTVLSVVYITELLIAIDYYNNIFSEKTKKIYKWLFGISLYSAAFATFLLFDNAAINISVFFVVNVAFALLCYSCTLKKAALSSLLMSAFVTSTEFLVIIISSIIFDGNIDTYRSSTAIFTVLSFISKLLYFMALKLSVMFAPGFKDNRKTKAPFFLFLFPVCAVLIFHFFYIVSALYELSKPLDITVSVLSIIIILSIIFTYIFYGKTQTELDELYKAQAEAERINTDIAYYTILDRQNEQLKAFIHDEKNHLTTIKSLSDNPELHEYIDKLYGEIKTHSSFGNTNNKMLDLMINKYQYICENENVDFSVSIKTANLNYIENTDLITMLGNLLDNSVEAAKASTEKRIDLSINIANGFDILTCSNSCDSKPLSIGKTLKTTKTDDGVHGLGIKSIKRIAGKYNGTFEWSYDTENREFTVYIAFKN